MLGSTIKKIVWHYPPLILQSLGLIYGIMEPYITLTGKKINMSYGQYWKYSIVLGTVWFLVDGFFRSGFLKRSIEIRSNGFDTKIVIKFGDIFKQDGWKSIAVNDLFDSIVDDHYVSSNSMHGMLLQKYWAGNIDDWNKQIDNQLVNEPYSAVVSMGGRQKRFEIGTTASIRKDGEKILCVALSNTDIATHETKANATNLHKAVRGLLSKARSVCANYPLNIPLVGSGLSRVGVKSNILVDLILTAIFEETKINKVTNEIRIILPTEKSSEINLATLKKDWE